MNTPLKLPCLWVLLLAPSAAAAPQITAILNAASLARPGLPNSGVAPGSLLVVMGEELGPAIQEKADGFPLRTSLGGTAINIIVGNTVLDALVVATSASQVTAILPSATPPGIGFLSVTYQGHTSQAGAFRIQPTAPGILTQNQIGTGAALAQNFNSDTDQPRNDLTHSAHPGQVVTLSAIGLGPINGDDALTPVAQDLDPDLLVLVGGKVAKVRYKGRSTCCAGVDQIVFEVPAGTEGCNVPVVLRSNDVVSNFATISVTSAGDVCSDLNGVSGAALEKLNAGAAVAWGSITLQVFPDCGDDDFCGFSASTLYDESASGSFERSRPGGYRAGLPSTGSCLPNSVGFTGGPFVGRIPLDAGSTLNLSGPKGDMQLMIRFPGNYFRQFSSLVKDLQFLGPGDYALDNGTGGADIGPFQIKLSVPKTFTSTIQQSAGGAKAVWSGGDPSGYAIIQVSGTATPTGLNAGFVCTESVATGQFTIPPEVMLSLPPTPPGRSIQVSVTSPVITTFRAPGLDFGQFTFFSAAQ